MYVVGQTAPNVTCSVLIAYCHSDANAGAVRTQQIVLDRGDYLHTVTVMQTREQVRTQQ